MVTGAHGAPGAPAAGLATEAKCGVTERATIPDRPMGVERVLELIQRSRNAASCVALVKSIIHQLPDMPYITQSFTQVTEFRGLHLFYFLPHYSFRTLVTYMVAAGS